MNITHSEASQNILRAVRTRTLTQGKWHAYSAGDGKEIVCLLGSIHPSVTNAAECNGDLMPMWLAELTPTLFDGIPTRKIYSIAKRYGTLVAKWHTITPTQWQTILNKFLVYTIDTALNAARPQNIDQPYWNQVEDVCNQCKVAIMNNDKFAADAAANAATYAAANAATYAAANAATYAAANAAANAAAAARAGAAAAAAATYAARAGAAAADKTYLSLFTFLLDQIEEECAKC